MCKLTLFIQTYLVSLLLLFGYHKNSALILFLNILQSISMHENKNLSSKIKLDQLNMKFYAYGS